MDSLRSGISNISYTCIKVVLHQLASSVPGVSIHSLMCLKHSATVCRLDLGENTFALLAIANFENSSPVKPPVHRTELDLCPSI